MDLFTDPDMPHWLKMLIWTAIGLVALASLVKSLRGVKESKLTQFIASQFVNNGGSTVMDKIDRCLELAEQAKKEAGSAKEEVRRCTDVSERTDQKVDWMICRLIGKVPTPEQIEKEMRKHLGGRDET